MIAHLNLRRNLTALYIAIGAHAFAFYVLYNTLVLWLISLGLPKATATSRFGAFVFAAYATPMLGGWISTRIGLRPVAVVGAAMAATGYLLTSLSPLAGIVLVGIGCGFVKTAVTAMVGRLFPEGAPGADKAFAWFYSAINVGAFFSPIAASYLMSRYGFTTAFAVAAIGDLVVLATIAIKLLVSPSSSYCESASGLADHRNHSQLHLRDPHLVTWPRPSRQVDASSPSAHLYVGVVCDIRCRWPDRRAARWLRTADRV